MREKRQLEGRSQADLAREVGISRNYLSQIERGEAVNLSWQVKKKLADTLGISVEKR
ncbi:MAG: helix-turn-helix transcriptional regulator [bacterium]|nr:helix-turn-helix transcriptional regulator [bacterium]